MARAVRFDDTAAEDDLGLKLRPPLQNRRLASLSGLRRRPEATNHEMVGDRRMDGPRQLTLEDIDTAAAQRHESTLSAVAAAFDPARLTQARRLADLTKTALAQELGVSAVAVGQWEAGTHPPRPDHVGRLAERLKVPPAFLAGRSAVRPAGELGGALPQPAEDARTPAGQGDCLRRASLGAGVRPREAGAVAAGRPAWLHRWRGLPGAWWAPIRFRLPRRLRRAWGLGTAPIPRMVRLLEAHGLIVTLVPFAGAATATVSAFSTSQLPRPIVVLTPDRANDVYRHRFTAAHEVGHLLLHGDCVPGDIMQEKEADSFAAEFLTPGEVIRPELPPRMDLKALEGLGQEVGRLGRFTRLPLPGGRHRLRTRLPSGVPAAQPVAQARSVRAGAGRRLSRRSAGHDYPRVRFG